MAVKEKKTRKRGKRVRKGRKHESVKIWKKYEVRGEEVSRKNRFCPRCGAGSWLSEQKNRLYCGKCGYTSFMGGKSPQSAQQEKPEKPEEEDQKPREGEEEKKPEGEHTEKE